MMCHEPRGRKREKAREGERKDVSEEKAEEGAHACACEREESCAKKRTVVRHEPV